MPQAPPALHLPGDPVIIRHPGQAGRRPADAVIYDIGNRRVYQIAHFPCHFPKAILGILARRTQDSRHIARYPPGIFRPHGNRIIAIPLFCPGRGLFEPQDRDLLCFYCQDIPGFPLSLIHI